MAAGGGAAGGGDGSSGSKLVSATSLGTYSGATLATGAIWTVVKQIISNSRIAALVVAALVALALQALAPPLPKTMTTWGRGVVWTVIFLANVAVLWSAALGINESADEVGIG